MKFTQKKKMKKKIHAIKIVLFKNLDEIGKSLHASIHSH